ncbi:hypothetical protein RhiirA1_463913 [Rhizophagus irregularis]|uniref:Uncharacterized protein n=1 Tax=Rhizophagus irregularis TaxID=588596 RepID=A0A2N0RJ48_9GLOM|nr:hypothetical protein RhiirA1_463913 [Rhizophagus irregularis]
MSLYDLLYWITVGVGKCFAKGSRVLMYDVHNVPGYPNVGEKPRLAISDYIWEIPIKDFLAASNEVQRSCLMPKLSLNLSKEYFALFFQTIEQCNKMLNWRCMKELHKTIVDDSEWKFFYDIENRFAGYLDTRYYD